MSIIIFFLTAGLLFYLFKASLSERCHEGVADCISCELSLKELFEKKEAIETEIGETKAILVKTAKIYEAARDICTNLDEDKLFLRFQEDLKKLINYQDCRIVVDRDPNIVACDDCAVFPLTAEDVCFGILILQGVLKQEHPYLHILAGQLALGLRRARLCRMIEDRAITDGLTGLYTKKYAFQRFDEEFARSKHKQRLLSLLMIDIDNFKDCNDKYGHLVGDTVLCEVAKRVKENIREVDMLARFGGEEFIVFISNTTQQGVSAIAERIRLGVEASPVYAYDEVVRVTVSIGLSFCCSDIKEPSDLLDRADLALYQAKRTGKNKVCVF